MTEAPGSETREPAPLPGAADPAREQRFFARGGAVVLLAVLVYLVWRIVAPLWQPLAWAALLGALLAPWNARLARRLGGRRRLASGLTTLGVVVLLLLPFVAIGGAVELPGGAK